jgi:hypothetical protein
MNHLSDAGKKVQRCKWCDRETGRCEDDSLYWDDFDGPLCDECFDTAYAEGMEDDEAEDAYFRRLFQEQPDA